MADWASWAGWWCRLLGHSSCYSLSPLETLVVGGTAILAPTLGMLMILNFLLKLLER